MAFAGAGGRRHVTSLVCCPPVPSEARAWGDRARLRARGGHQNHRMARSALGEPDPGRARLR